MRFVYLHGLNGNATGIKYQWFRSCCSELETLHLSNDVYERLAFLKTKIQEPVCFVGNSLGSLTAMMFANLYPHYVRSMLLCVPPIELYNYRLTPREKQTLQKMTIPSSIHSYIIGAKYDGVCVYSATKGLAFQRANPKNTLFYTAIDTHSLLRSKAVLIYAFRQLLADL